MCCQEHSPSPRNVGLVSAQTLTSCGPGHSLTALGLSFPSDNKISSGHCISPCVPAGLDVLSVAEVGAPCPLLLHRGPVPCPCVLGVAVHEDKQVTHGGSTRDVAGICILCPARVQTMPVLFLGSSPNEGGPSCFPVAC